MESHPDAELAHREFCDGFAPDDKCFSPGEHYIDTFNSSSYTCYSAALPHMELHEVRSVETLRRLLHVFCTIVPVLCWFAVARLVTQFCPCTTNADTALRFALEFALIVVPTVVGVNVANGYVEYIAVGMCILVVLVLWSKRCLAKARARQFEWGQRPYVFTLARTTINFLTAVCILAIDFESFPKVFRKSRRYGAGLMDVGIGLFVFSMATVSRRPRKGADIVRLVRMVTPVLFLGLLRTVVILAINYHQDEHEYGVHLNAFFTLGLSKLFGTTLSAVARTKVQLLALGLGVLAFHELTLQMGLSEYVMDNHIERNTFWKANREGLVSLTGFVALYLLSRCLAKWLQEQGALNFRQFMHKLASLTIACAGLWLVLINCVFTVGIARVTANFGYVIWMLAIASTMMLLFMFVFDLVLNTLWPVAQGIEYGGGEGEYMLKSQDTRRKAFVIPTLVEAINMNGLLYFLLANVLTGGVNIYLAPEDRSDVESVVILSIYMLIATGFVYLLYRYKLRIA